MSGVSEAGIMQPPASYGYPGTLQVKALVWYASRRDACPPANCDEVFARYQPWNSYHTSRTRRDYEFDTPSRGVLRSGARRSELGRQYPAYRSVVARHASADHRFFHRPIVSF